MPAKTLPWADATIIQLAERLPTPFYLYHEDGIRASAQALLRAFAWAPGFREYFAVKATPNPAILRVLASEGIGADCSSLPELLLAERAGLSGAQIMFSSNNTPAEEFREAQRLGAIINLDDLGLLPYLFQHAGVPEMLSFRYNPGPLRRGNAIIGEPREAKFGLTREQLFLAYQQARQAGVRRFGLHTMVVSNELDPQSHFATANMLFELALELEQNLGIRLEVINLGGGYGIPYRPDQNPLDLQWLGAAIQRAYRHHFGGEWQPQLALECGRIITGPHGYLVSRVRHLKQTYKHYVGLDATMANLMRPGMYGAYHHLTVVGKTEPPNQVYDVTGSLCENNDKFAIDRHLPVVEVGDLVVIHDAGAHGHAMGFNYNGKLRSAEYLWTSQQQLRCIRRAETVTDLFATLVE